MRRRVLAVDVGHLVPAMIQHPGQLVDVLVQGSAERDVHLLEAAANREQRHPTFDAAVYERQRGLVAVRVVQGAGPAGRLSVVPRQHVRRAAREQEAVDRIEQIVVRDGAPEGGDEERQRSRRRAHRGDVLLLDDVVDAAFEVAPACGDANNGFTHEDSSALRAAGTGS